MRRTEAARRLGVITAVTALTSAVATPTLGQPGPVTIDVSIADVVVPAGGTSDALVVIDTNRATELADLTLVFDLSALAGVATIDPGSGFTCDTTGDLVTCTEPFPTPIDEDPLSVLSLEVIAEPGAVAGDTGTLGVEVAATGVAAAASSATVIIGVPVDLVGTGSGAGTSAAIGDAVMLPWAVQNAGPDPAPGAALFLSGAAGLQPQVRHSNCVYYGNAFFPDLPGGSLCTFAVTLEPGTAYEFGTPPGFQVREDAAAPGFLVINGIWMTREEGAAMAAQLAAEGRTSEPGTGPELSLVEVGGGAPAPAGPVPAADLNPDNNFVIFEVTVEGDNQPDFGAVGGRFSGGAGDLLTADLGVINAGPAIASNGQSGEPVNFVRVTVPDGTTAVEVPNACAPAAGEGFDGERAGAPGEPVYVCQAGLLLPVGETESFPFVLRIDRVIPDATGLVEVNQAAGQPTKPADRNPDNDVAEILVNATGGGGGTGGGLPTTGTASWLVVAAGGLLISLGAIIVLLVRRRRTQFVA